MGTVPGDSAHADLDLLPKPTLNRGRFMICPNCGMQRDPLNASEFKRLDRIEEYKHELNIVFLCVKHTGGCGHVFSPTSPEFTKIIEAWLRGDLVSREQANVITDDKPIEVANI